MSEKSNIKTASGMRTRCSHVMTMMVVIQLMGK